LHFRYESYFRRPQVLRHELEFLERRRAEEERAAAASADPQSSGVHRQLAADYSAALNAFRNYSSRAEAG
jgi:hypothetical protein